MMDKKIRTFMAAVLLVLTACGARNNTLQEEAAGPQVEFHSHNDYAQAEPFYGAFRAGAGSIEADVFLVDSTVMLGHDSPTDHSIREGYLEPIRKAFLENDGSVYPDGRSFQLVVDLKDGVPALKALQKLIEEEYMPCFDVRNNPGAARLVITGNAVKPDEYHLYPDFVFFDTRPGVEFTDEQLERVAMVSDYFGNYSKWKGRDTLGIQDREVLRQVIEDAHARGKKIRFWAFPDNPLAWQTTIDLGIDFINTDHPAKVAEYLGQKEK